MVEHLSLRYVGQYDHLFQITVDPIRGTCIVEQGSYRSTAPRQRPLAADELATLMRCVNALPAPEDPPAFTETAGFGATLTVVRDSTTRDYRWNGPLPEGRALTEPVRWLKTR